ncbi:sugar phosphate nucleotidyltransferase [Streptomyces sp. NPDC058252]|uniref:sugar phosphate nucleotidyltransferase n=1 Tax=Streptomyces sp. NPDC058252 TaxID=3346405 RepID=UPI0036EA185A
MKIAGVILCGGLGSRMGPLTYGVPKPALPLWDRPMVHYLAERLTAAGAAELFVNVHHLPDAMRGTLDRLDTPVPLTVRHEAELTGPAGALRVFAAELAAFDIVLVSSADVLLGDDLAPLLRTHRDGGARLTFAVTRVRRARHFGVLDIDAEGRVRRAREKPDVPDEELHLVSAGVYCLDPGLLDRIPSRAVYDYARDLAPAMIAAREPVMAYSLPGYWRDLGTPESLRDAHLDAVSGRIPWLAAGSAPLGADCAGPVQVAPTARLAGGTVLRGPVYVGAGARVGAGTWLERTVVLPGAEVMPGSVLVGALVAGPRTWPAPDEKE